MAGNRPDLKITVHDGDGRLKELAAARKPTEKEYFSMARFTALMRSPRCSNPAAEIPVFVFKGNAEPKPAEPKSRRRPAEKPQPRPAA